MPPGACSSVLTDEAIRLRLFAGLPFVVIVAGGTTPEQLSPLRNLRLAIDDGILGLLLAADKIYNGEALFRCKYPPAMDRRDGRSIWKQAVRCSAREAPCA
jgi:hypothetical protein